QEHYYSLNQEGRKTEFLTHRDDFNSTKLNGDDSLNLKKASLFIFLNRTCFNGLYRVNKKGQFNVPIGSYKKPLICDKDNLLKLSKSLKNVQIQCSDYKECLPFIDKRTFVYIDPPYRPLSQTSSFTAYSETSFNDENQIELNRFVDSIHEKGAKVLISNSDPKNEDVNDSFFDNLYSQYRIERVPARRIINCNAENRGEINELLINNY
ncbi:MAG: Dam family site-specific DNA-(adenine-N6)-methyltransferase, partial [Methanosarcinales archaeon]|nr:Dam family site-specific DNA-(adenine-N6)-methyltransferase [Methanosarcinales archaeon]